jgi:hypothetical protein
VRRGGAGHPDGSLAVQRLPVQRPFAGDHQPRAVELLAEREHLQQQFDAGPHLRAEEKERREADAAGRAGAG